MSDLVREGGDVDEGELLVLEKSGVLASPKLKGKAKARTMSRPKHIVFVEEGEEGSSCLIFCRIHAGDLSRPYCQTPTKGLQTQLLLQPSITMTDLILTWAGNLKVTRNERRENKGHRDRTNPIHNSWRKNRRFGVPRPFDAVANPKFLHAETSTAAGSGTFSSDGPRSTATVCRAGAGDAEIADGERSDKETEGS